MPPSLQGAGIVDPVDFQTLGQHGPQFGLIILGLPPVHRLVEGRRLHGHDQALVRVGGVDALPQRDLLDLRAGLGQLLGHCVQAPATLSIGAFVKVASQQPDARRPRLHDGRQVIAHRLP